MADTNRDPRSAAVDDLADALDNLYNSARVIEKNRRDFNLLERRLAGMLVEDACRGIGYLNRADIFNEPLI